VSLTDEAKAEQAEEDIRVALTRTLRQLEEAKVSKAELVEAVYRAAHDAAVSFTYSPVPRPVKRKTGRNAEVAVAMLGDWQLGKVTPDYNSGACEDRIRQFADKVIEMTEIQRADHPVDELHVWLLGDLVEGELIFPGQAHRIDGGLYRQVVLDGPRILSDFLRRMLTAYTKVSVTAVIGNHGAIGGASRREMAPDTNSDRMLYRIVADRLSEEKRLTWIIPDAAGERSWYAIDQIGNYSCLLFHGDQIRGGFAGMPFYGFYKAINGWASGAIREPFGDAACGHWHQHATLTFNQRILRINGSTESYNTWSQEQLKAMGDPSQRLMFVHPEKGKVTCEYQIYLT
jgi:hypothetical protein